MFSEKGLPQFLKTAIESFFEQADEAVPITAKMIISALEAAWKASPPKQPVIVTTARLREFYGVEFSKAQLNRLENQGIFPRRIWIGGKTPCWMRDEVEAYLATRIDAREAATAKKSAHGRAAVSTRYQKTEQAAAEDPASLL